MTLEGVVGSATLIPLLRELQASIAKARQLLLTFAMEAAALESLSFPAYSQIFGGGEVGAACGSGPSSKGTLYGEPVGDGEPPGELGTDDAGEDALIGDGRPSASWLVMPLQTVFANRDVNPGAAKYWGVSVSFPSSRPSSELEMSSSAAGVEALLAKPFHIDTLSIAPSPVALLLGILASSSLR